MVWFCLVFVLALVLVNAWWLDKITQLNHDLYKEVCAWMEIQENINKEVAQFMRRKEASHE